MTQRPPQRIPLFVPLLGLAAGIAAAGAGASFEMAAWTSVGAIILLAARCRRMVGIALLFFSFGLADANIQGPANTTEPPRTPATFCGTVVRVGRTAHGGTSITLRDLSGEWQGWEPRRRGGVRVSIPEWPGRARAPREGDRVAVTARCEAVQRTDNANSFERYLKATGIGYTARADASDVVILRPGRGIAAALRRAAFAAGDALSASPLDERTSGFLRTLLFGDRTTLDSDVRADFAGAGLAHVLAVSGLHVGIIIAILGAALLPLGRLGRGRVRQALILAGVWVFAAMAGFSPSVVRAAVMASFLLLAAILQRYNSSINALCAAGLLILAVDPTALGDPGFQLSFLSVAGILTFSHAIRHLDTKHTHRLLRLAGAGAAGICALLMTWPLSLRMFGEVAPMGVVASMIVLPVLPVYMGVGIVFAALAACGHAPVWMARLLDAGLDGALRIARFLSGGGGTTIGGDADTIVCLLWTAGALLLCIALIRRRHIPARVGGALMVAAVVVMFAMPWGREGNVRINQTLRGATISYRPAGGGGAHLVEVPGRGATLLSAGGLRILSVGAGCEARHARAAKCDVLLIGSGFRGRIEEAAAGCGAGEVVVCRRGIAGSVDAEAALIRSGKRVHIPALDGPAEFRLSAGQGIPKKR